MAFPTTPILDSFTGADENPITTNWTCPLFSGEGNLRRISNQLAEPVSTAGGAYYDISSFGPDSEAYITVSTVLTQPNHMSIYARMVNPGTATPTGYRVQYLAQAGTDIIRIERLDTGGVVTLGADISQEIANGDSLGIEVIGTTISAYYKASAGSWTSLGSRTDSTYSAAGSLAVEIVNDTGSRYDDFGGGTVVVSYPVVAWLTA